MLSDHRRDLKNLIQHNSCAKLCWKENLLTGKNVSDTIWFGRIINPQRRFWPFEEQTEISIGIVHDLSNTVRPKRS